MKILYADRSDRNYVRCVNDVVYDTSKDIPLHLQMLYPQVPSELAEIRAAERDGRHKRELSEAEEKRSARSMPCIVYVQGSAWGKQDIYGTLPMLVDIARMGFVVASVEYRPVTMEPFPGFVMDVKAAIRFLKANADLYGIDPDRIAIWGCSSGGHTSLMVGSTGWTKEFDDDRYPEQDSSVAACVAYYGVAEFSRFWKDGPFPRPQLFDHILGKEAAKDPDNVARISPVTYIHPEQAYPPFLLIHGDMDQIVPFEQSEIMYGKLTECGHRADFYQVRGAGHGTAFWTKEVLDITGQFFKAYV